ncbi:MAG TPA: uroporphyrinogen-III C-methyltransferase [Thermoanaerobaculia bacterium]|nr:uroporphyrinogen-III C-methyltransferase [Thermoanaerobaculia bacterium]
MSGIVYLVGAGPGDPRLITLLGLERLRQADVVIYDRLVSERLLAEAPPTAERIYVGKAPGEHSAKQEEINELLLRHARMGKIVVRLKGGDPFVFGRGSEEALACAEAGVPWEVVPGVSSAISVPALAGIPVTHREIAGGFAVVTGHCAEGDRQDWAALARVETLIILMGLSRLPEISASLLFHGREANTPVAAIAQGSLPGERVVVGTLGTIAGDVASEGLRAPATIVVGEVVRVRQRLLSAVHDFAQPELEDQAEVLGLLG